MILVAVLQDPVRKLVPGAPSYLVLASVPIWLSMLVGAWACEHNPWKRLRAQFPFLAGMIVVFLVTLIPAAYQSATYGAGSWQLTAVGLFAYLSGIGGLLTGYLFPQKAGDTGRLLAFYCIVTGIVLVGVPLQYLGVAGDWPVLGTERLGHEWLRYRPGYVVRMIAGFYRSPDIMGWHAALLVMSAAAR